MKKIKFYKNGFLICIFCFSIICLFFINIYYADIYYINDSNVKYMQEKPKSHTEEFFVKNITKEIDLFEINNGSFSYKLGLFASRFLSSGIFLTHSKLFYNPDVGNIVIINTIFLSLINVLFYFLYIRIFKNNDNFHIKNTNLFFNPYFFIIFSLIPIVSTCYSYFCIIRLFNISKNNSIKINSIPIYLILTISCSFLYYICLLKFEYLEIARIEDIFKYYIELDKNSEFNFYPEKQYAPIFIMYLFYFLYYCFFIKLICLTNKLQKDNFAKKINLINQKNMVYVNEQ